MNIKKSIVLFLICSVILNLAACKKQQSDLTNASDESEPATTESTTLKEKLNLQPTCVTISASTFCSVAIKNDGTVIATPTASNASFSQDRVSDWSNIISVAAGGLFTAGLKADGTVIVTESAWHDESFWQSVSEWSDIVALSAGYWHLVGLKSDGTVVAACTDSINNDGQCNVSNWSDIVSISAGYKHTVGVKSDGTVIATGDNTDGRCNVSDWDDIIAVSAGYRHTVGLKSDGTVVATGYNTDGRCNVSDWTDIVAVSAGDLHTVGLKKGGTVVATDDSKLSNILASSNYGQCRVKDWSNIVAISAGTYHTIGLKSDGTVISTAFSHNKTSTSWATFCNVSDWQGIRLPDFALHENSTDNGNINTSQNNSDSGGVNSNSSNNNSGKGQLDNSSENSVNVDTSNQSSVDNENKDPCANGHKWVEATCSSPETCSVCGKTSGKPLGHDLYITKCTRCDYTDFSRLAKSYSDEAVTAYDSKTGEDYTVTNVKLSNSGIFSFNFNGKQYALSVVQTDKQEGTSGLVVFDCYIDGKIEPDATFYIAPDYLNPRLEWEHLDGCNLYIYVDV